MKVFECVLVTTSLKGLKAQLSRPVRQMLPFSIDHLCKFYLCLDFSEVSHLSCWCAMLLAFFGCFRLSNLVPGSKSKYDKFKQLSRDDIKFENDIVLIYYKWSKTNQNCNRVAWIPICRVKDERFDVKIYLKLLLDVVKAPKEAPLFSFRKNKFHTRNTLVKLLDMCVFDSGLNIGNYSWHSFRRGSAVFAFELGIADTAVQRLGNWSSMAFKHYLEFAFLKKVSVAKKISKSFDTQLKSM